jgi:MoxR-like ATPase
MEPTEPTPEAETVAPAQVAAAKSMAERIAENIRRAVKVKDDVLNHAIVALLAEGHILVEDYPGVGKTALARALSRTLASQFARVQCTSDLLPADIVGTNVYHQREGRYEFRPGPISANVVIVDEVNRASPKTQSGLLECMQERQVTVDAMSHELARPFLVFATQNPVEYEGTYPLPEAQVDRFMVRISLGYPDAADVLLMAAAVADYRPADAHAGKLKKEAAGELNLQLVRTTDVLSALAATRRPGQVLIGFAAEHGDGALAHARGKLDR